MNTDDGELLVSSGDVESENDLFKCSSDDSNTDKDDFYGMSMGIFKKLNVKIALFLFFIFMTLNTTMFVEKLEKIKDATANGHSTEKGTLIQGMLLVIAYMIFDLFVSNDVL
jgi:hypothetical protein